MSAFAREDSRLVDEAPRSVGVRDIKTKQQLVDTRVTDGAAADASNHRSKSFARDCVLSIAGFLMNERDEQAVSARFVEALDQMPDPRAVLERVEVHMPRSSEAIADGMRATARIGFASTSDAVRAMHYLRDRIEWLKGTKISQCKNVKFTTRIVHNIGACNFLQPPLKLKLQSLFFSSTRMTYLIFFFKFARSQSSRCDAR